jgi:hypothetical protein
VLSSFIFTNKLKLSVVVRRSPDSKVFQAFSKSCQ